MKSFVLKGKISEVISYLLFEIYLTEKIKEVNYEQIMDSGKRY